MSGDALDRAQEIARAYLAGVDEHRVAPAAGADELLSALGGPLPASGSDPAQVVEQLAAGATPGLVASAGTRYFGFVVGGAVEAAVGADWLTSAWDQMAGLYISSPAA